MSLLTVIRPERMLLLALVVAGFALVGSRADTNAAHGPAGTQLWGYEGYGRILQYDIGAHVASPNCVPAVTPGYPYGRGIAFDQAQGNLWYTSVDPTFGDGYIHKTTPPSPSNTCTPLPTLAIRFIDGPGGTYQDNVGALDIDPSPPHDIWAAGYTAIGGQSFLYKIDRLTGDLVPNTWCSVPVGGGQANDTLAVAVIAGVPGGPAGPTKYLLTDADELGTVLHVINAAGCLGGVQVTPVIDVTLPIGVTGIDYEDLGDSQGPKLIATDLTKIYNLGGFPFSSVSGTEMGADPSSSLEDITLVTCPTCRVGGTTQLLVDGSAASASRDGGPGSSAWLYAAIAGGAAAAALAAVVAGGWYARRRWLR